MLMIDDEIKPYARQYATQVMPYAMNRMGAPDRRRWERLYLRRLAEMVVERHLGDEYGMEILPEVVGHADMGDGRFVRGDGEGLSVDIKTFNIYRTFRDEVRTSEMVRNRSWALVPLDQFRNNPKAIYVFGFLLGNVIAGPDGQPDVESGSFVCSLAWASCGDVEKWDLYPPGASLFPYFGTRTCNAGELVKNVRPMNELVRFVERC